MSKGRILVVDDEEIVLKSCMRALEPAGFEVHTVKSGFDGLKLLDKQKFDVVLTDLKMPDIDGIEVLRIVKEKWPAIEVIIITGYQTVETAVKAIKLGAMDYIEKPFTPDQLLGVVSHAIPDQANQ